MRVYIRKAPVFIHLSKQRTSFTYHTSLHHSWHERVVSVHLWDSFLGSSSRWRDLTLHGASHISQTVWSSHRILLNSHSQELTSATGVFYSNIALITVVGVSTSLRSHLVVSSRSRFELASFRLLKHWQKFPHHLTPSQCLHKLREQTGGNANVRVTNEFLYQSRVSGGILFCQPIWRTGPWRWDPRLCRGLSGLVDGLVWVWVFLWSISSLTYRRSEGLFVDSFQFLWGFSDSSGFGALNIWTMIRECNEAKLVSFLLNN